MAHVERPSFIKKVLASVGLMTAGDLSRLLTSSLLSTPQTLGYFTGAKTYQEIIESYKSWTYICIDKIAKTVAMLPLHLYAYKQNGKFVSGHQIKMRVHEFEGNKREIARFIKSDNIDKEEIFNHPFLDLQKNPNPLMTRFQLWYHILTRLELAGYCGLFLPRKGIGGIPSEMWPLPLTKTAILKATVDKVKLISSWRYEDGDVRIDLTTDECKVIMYPDPESPFTGKSPLLAQQLPYDIDSYLDQQQRAFLMKHSAFGNVFTTEQKLSDAQVTNLKTLLKSQYAGAQNSGEAIFMHSGLKLDRSIVSNDAMNVDLARYARDKLIATHDLTPSHVGIDREVNRTTMEVLDDVFIRECLRPKTQLVEEFFETFILPLYDERLLLDFELPDTKDKEFELKKRDSNLDRAYTTINEERMAEGLEPVAWGDEPLPKVTQIPVTTITMGDQPVEEPVEPVVDTTSTAPVNADGLNGAQITAAVTLIGEMRAGRLTGESAVVLLMAIGISQEDASRMVSAEAAAPPIVEVVNTPPVAPVEPTPPVKAVSHEVKIASPVQCGKVTEETKVAMWNGYAKKTEAWENVLTQAMNLLLEEQYTRVVENIGKEGIKFQGNIAGWSKDKIRQHIKAKDSTAKFNLDRKAEIVRTKEVFDPIFKALVLDAGSSRLQTLLRTPLKAAASTIVGVAFNVNDPKVKKWLGTRLDTFSESITGTTFDAVKAVLKEGFAEGKPLATITQELRAMFDGAEAYRAPLIARTETISATNFGDIEAVEQSGMSEKIEKHWLSARDGNERETHQAADVKYADVGIAVDELFEVGEDVMVAPGNGSIASENINCFVEGTFLFSPSIEGIFKNLYNGEIITIETAAGHKLSGTPNHPILTSRGFVPLGLLNKFDSVIATLPEEWIRLCNLDEENTPTEFQKMYDLLSSTGISMRAKRSDVDFYGDRPASDVDIVLVNGLLMNATNTESSKPIEHINFPSADVASSRLLSNSLLDSESMKEGSRELFQSDMGSGSELLSIAESGIAHTKEHGVTSIPCSQSNAVQTVDDTSSSDTKTCSDSLDRLSGDEKILNDSRINIRSLFRDRSSIPLDVTSVHDSIDITGSASMSLSNLSDVFSCKIFSDHVVNVHRSSYCGLVYTAQCHNGIYISNGVVVKNCRCTVYYSEKEKE